MTDSISENRNPFSLSGRSVLITGGTQGVGGAVAIACANAGANLVLQGREDNSHTRETVERCQELGVRVDVVLLDLLSPNASGYATDIVNRLFDLSMAKNADIDCLVNNVGTYMESSFLELTEETYNRTLRLNLSVGLFLTQRFAKHWIERDIFGRIVFTGSINGLLAEQEHVAYDASKGAVASMVRSLCTELAPHNIRVNSMAPGLVVTPLTGVLDTDKHLRDWMELHTPNGQVPDASVCGPPTVFLLSDAAKHIHGQTLYVDGGMSAWQQPGPPAS